MRKLWNNHPNLISWAVLAIGMVIIVVFSARNVGFQPSQWAAIIVATIILAGLCVWIVSWEGGGEDEAGAVADAAANGVTAEKPSSATGSSTGKEQDAAAREAVRSEDV